MILLISDYHGREDLVLKLIDTYHPEYLLCMGDGESDEAFYKDHKIISVRGNCDENFLPTSLILELQGKKFLLSHGHLTNVIMGLNTLYYSAKENNCDFVLYGHTHVKHYEVYDGVTFINPGALKDREYALIDENNEVIFKTL